MLVVVVVWAGAWLEAPPAFNFHFSLCHACMHSILCLCFPSTSFLNSIPPHTYMPRDGLADAGDDDLLRLQIHFRHQIHLYYSCMRVCERYA